ncbi:peptidase [Limosilactobacillus reuteri]|uniref:peptidase n=1 Tax=Limosilactobacillus reuteri TaxID=1598 RepID=UPI001E516CFF|nr:peptidase [Limosilactobacillus reuteri]MCC4456450.1 peptidase [Limosilactobacillus reuteri]MCC4464639.1 peptidase [Limosilactobacillus reuteri]
MLTQSKEVQNAWRASQRTLDIKVTIDGKTYGATDINSLKYDSGAYNGDTFAIGSTYSNTVQIEFSHLVEGLKLGMEVHPSIGIKTSSGYVYEPLGVFIISSEIKMDRNNNLTTVSASDRFCGLEGTYVSKLTYPAKVLDVIAEICAQSGVKANTDDLARLPHQADLPAPITGQSYRKALGWIAQLYVGYALFDRQGLFTIRTISEPNYELDPSQYEQAGLTKNEAAYKINGIQCQVTLTTKTRDGESTEETKNYQAGDATGSQIKLENNIMTPQRLNDIWEQLKDITFYPFSLNWFGNPAVEAGDWLRLEDKQGNSFVVPNSSYTLDFNGGLSATSKADQTTSSDQMVPWQGSVAQTIKELQLRRLPDGTVVFPPSVTEPPTNAKFNDVWFKKNGNSTELWIFEKQDDGAGKWIRKDLSDDEIKKKVADAQQGLNQAKADIIANKQKADDDVENLNKSIEDNKKVADESLQKLNDSVTNLQGQYDNSVVPNLNKVMADASDALQKYIAAQNSIADLTKQAQQQGKDIADVSNTVKGLNINYANLAGDVNSTKVDVKGLQTTVGTANGDIAQLKLDAQNLQTMLAGKVDNTTYTNFVNLTNQALNARLTASDLNGYAKTADVQATANGLQVNINSVNGKLDNLVIGGRNLVRNSGFPKNADYWNGVERATHDFYYTKKQPLFLIKANTTEERLGSSTYFPLKRNTDYVVSFKGFASVNVSSYDIFILARKYGETNSYSSIKHLVDAKRLSGSSVQYVKDLVFNSGENDEAYFRIDNNGSSDGRDAWLFFTEVKVEEGNKSTAWTAAPEDEEEQINGVTSQLSARIEANSQHFSSYYTKVEADNRTNSAKEEAKSNAVNTIKGDANWTGLKNVLTNSGFLQTADGFLQKVQQTTIPMFNGGGINLATKTGNVSLSGGYNSSKNIGYISLDAINDLCGKYMTVSVDVEWSGWKSGNQNRVGYELQINYDDGSTEYDGCWLTPTTANGKQRVTATYKIKDQHVKSLGKGNAYIQINCTSAKVSRLKIEQGSVATPWIPNPADLATQSAFSELSQSLEGLRSTVGSNYGSLQSQISQSSTAVRTELTDKINGVDSKTTSTANSLNSVIGRVGSLENLTNIRVVNNAINANDYTNTGNYFIQSTDNINVPGTNWCYLKVEKVNDGRIVQTWQADSDPTLRYARTKFGDSWTQWQRSASYSEYSELNRTVQGLQSTVSSNHSDLQSQISQTAKNIRQEVSDKTNGLQTQINQQANNFNVSLNSLRKETAWQKVTSAIDANNYKTTGNYWIQATPNSNTPDSSAWAYLQVVASPDAKRIKQTWQRDNNENEIYTRLLIEDNWTSWQRTVTGGNIMAQINMSAGTTLIQNDKIYMDASSTIFSGNAFIPSAAITSLNADKITAGTINGAKVNVINLNANNITAGTLRGSNGEFYLDSGALHVWQNNHDAWIDQNGIHDYDNQGNNVWISRGSISAYGNSSGAYLFDGGLYLHKSQSLSDAVLDPDYGSITKSDNIVSFGTSGLDIEGKDGFLLRTHGWNDQTLSYLNGNEIIGAGIAGKSDGFINIAAKKQLFLYAGEPIQNNNLKTIPNLVLDGTYQNGQTVLKGTFSQYFFQGPSSGFSGGITLQDEFVNVGSLNGKNYFSINSDGAITITANGKSILSLNGLFPGVNSDFNVRGNFAVTGSKNAIVPTSRGMAAINAYETAEYYFGDIGETQTNSNGVVTVMIDPYFLETVNTLVPYQVFLTSYGDGNVWVSSRSANNFTVKSSNPNIHFAWEIKAKRKGYENDRMKIVKGVFNNEQY